MAGVKGIKRDLTETERKEMIEIGAKTPRDAVIKQLTEKEAEYTKKHLPFSYAAAKMDIDDAFDKINKEMLRAGKDKDLIAKNFNSKFDFDKYGEPKRFELISTKEIHEIKVMDGIKTSYFTGYFERFYDKIRPQCKIGVEIPKKVYEKRHNIKEPKEQSEAIESS